MTGTPRDAGPARNRTNMTGTGAGAMAGAGTAGAAGAARGQTGVDGADMGADGAASGRPDGAAANAAGMGAGTAGAAPGAAGPLRNTPLSAIVDAAARMEQGQREATKPATMRNVMLLVGALTATGLTGALINGMPLRLAAGGAMMFVGVVTGWSQVASVLHPSSKAERNRSVALGAGGACMALVGVLMLFSRTMPLGDVMWGALAGMLMVLVLAVIVAPWWISMVSDLGRQRAAAAREELRADFTSRLHDSVLQTLALIQLHADDSAKVAALARSQERDLREWLYGDPDAVAGAGAGPVGGMGAGSVPAVPGGAGAGQAAGAGMGGGVGARPVAGARPGAFNGPAGAGAPVWTAAGAAMPHAGRTAALWGAGAAGGPGAAGSGIPGAVPGFGIGAPGGDSGPVPDTGTSGPSKFSSRLKRLAAQVEDSREVPIEVVAVGDCPFAPGLDPLLRASGEAMVNAAKHGRPPIGVYMEVGGGAVQVFVRDHGDGFDVDAPHEGHLGISSSIVGRMRRAGGTSQIVSRPGWGTEVRLSMPL